MPKKLSMYSPEDQFIIRVHASMKTRCTNKNAINYRFYGGRGIKVCPEWHTRAAFLRDMGYPPALDYSLDRIDPNGDYSKSNCRWVHKSEQNHNRRDNRNITYRGETKTLSAWCKQLNLNYWSVRYRLNKGFPVDRVLEPTKTGFTGSGKKGK